MPRPPPENNYTCPRCGYDTMRKSNIIAHFKRKQLCPPELSDIVLTDAIKEHIQQNRIVCQMGTHMVQVINNSENVVVPNTNTEILNVPNTSENKTVSFHEPNTSISVSIPNPVVVTSPQHTTLSDIHCISNLAPLETKTACGKDVWVLYAKSADNANRAPIRVVIENGVRKMHLFDFIQALTSCDINSTRKEWDRVEKSLEKHIVIKITMSKFRFPELDGQLARADSMIIDIYGAAKAALSIGKRANRFNEILTSLGNRSSVGDLTFEPDDIFRLWLEES